MSTPEPNESAAKGPKIQGHYPKCPPRERFPVITDFITPGSDFPPPHPLDASVTMDVFDPTEIITPGHFERIRVVEVDDPFLIEVNWCVCGAFAAGLAGCWELNFYLNTIDGSGANSSGPLGSTQKVDVASVKPVPGTNDDVTKRCYTLPFEVAANTVQVGAYSLLVVITLYTGTCANPGSLLGDYLGFAEIPVLVFIPGE
jgi:hypothetical protein